MVFFWQTASDLWLDYLLKSELVNFNIFWYEVLPTGVTVVLKKTRAVFKRIINPMRQVISFNIDVGASELIQHQ